MTRALVCFITNHTCLNDSYQTRLLARFKEQFLFGMIKPIKMILFVLSKHNLNILFFQRLYKISFNRPGPLGISIGPWQWMLCPMNKTSANYTHQNQVYPSSFMMLNFTFAYWAATIKTWWTQLITSTKYYSIHQQNYCPSLILVHFIINYILEIFHQSNKF